MIQVFKGFWSIEDIIKSPNKIFIYGDNDLRTGLGGQAIIRNESNTLGIRTKKKPTHEKDAYYTDKEFEDNKKKIIQDIKKISDELLFGTTIVFSEGGYGTDRAKLKEKAPKTYQFLCDILLEKFGYHNELGKIVPKPSELKNHLSIFINSTVVNPSFSSQTKEKLITEVKDFGYTFQVPDKIIKSILKSDIIE